MGTCNKTTKHNRKTTVLLFEKVDKELMIGLASQLVLLLPFSEINAHIIKIIQISHVD